MDDRMAEARERRQVQDECCSICGRDVARGGAVRFGRVRLCAVCERITVAIRPRHPLYAFWAHLLRLALDEVEGVVGS